jgi:hypothetical protein
MTQMLSERAAAVLVALAARPAGLRLAEISMLTGAPLSSAQRTVEALLDEGVLVRGGGGRPRYRVAPEIPVESLSQLAAWRLTPARAAQIRQQATAMEGEGEISHPDLDARILAALRDPETAARLEDMAERLIWWQSAAQALRRPERLIAQAMAIGTTGDAEFTESIFGIEALRSVLAAAPAGVFDPRRWDYWHLRFGYRRTPPMPARPA